VTDHEVLPLLGNEENIEIRALKEDTAGDGEGERERPSDRGPLLDLEPLTTSPY
jgi:hypothetical protein